MNKKLGRLLQPGMAWYFVVMFVFAVAALVMQQMVLAIVEAAVTAALFVIYQVMKTRRQREIQAFIQSTSDNLEAASRGESPFAMLLLRLADGTVIWSNERFAEISGFKFGFAVGPFETVAPFKENLIAKFTAASGFRPFPGNVFFKKRKGVFVFAAVKTFVPKAEVNDYSFFGGFF